jgi:hypothetical protein
MAATGKSFSDWSISKNNQKQEWPVVAMFVNGSGQSEQSL